MPSSDVASTPMAAAAKSLMRRTGERPVSAARPASVTTHGRLGVVHVPESTAPGTPKHAAATRALAWPMNSRTIGARPGYSGLG